MHIELTHNDRTGEDVLLFNNDKRDYPLPKHLDKVNEALADIPSRNRLKAMELAIKLEQQAHQETKKLLAQVVTDRDALDHNYQCVTNALLATNDDMSNNIISRILGSLRKRKITDI